MWVRRDDWCRLWGRVERLEGELRDSIAGDVYRASLARIKELERRVDWQADMLLRRGGTFPVPPTPEQAAEVKQNELPPQPSETAIAQAEAIAAEGKRVDAGREEIEAAIRAIPGMTDEAVAAVLSGGRVM